MNSKIDDLSPLLQFLIMMVIIIFCFGFFQILSAGIVYLLGFDLYNFTDPENIKALKIAQITASLGSFVVPACLFSFLKTNNFFGMHGFKKSLNPIILIATIALIFISFAFTTETYVFNKSLIENLPESFSFLKDAIFALEAEAEKLMQAFLEMNSFQDFLLNFLMVAIIAGFAEEILFRGTMQKFLTNKADESNNKFAVHLAIFFTAFVFSAIHMQFFGFLARMLLGVLFGYVFYWTKNIWYPIIAHTVFNGMQVIMYYLFQKNQINVNIDEVDSFPKSAVLMSLLLTILTLYFIYKLAKKEDAKLIDYN